MTFLHSYWLNDSSLKRVCRFAEAGDDDEITIKRTVVKSATSAASGENRCFICFYYAMHQSKLKFGVQGAMRY